MSIANWAPRPAGVQLRIQMPQPGAALVRLFDATGRVWVQREVTLSATELALPGVAALPAGVY